MIQIKLNSNGKFRNFNVFSIHMILNLFYSINQIKSNFII